LLCVGIRKDNKNAAKENNVITCRADSKLYLSAKTPAIAVETEPSPKEKKNRTPKAVALRSFGVINPAKELKAG